MSLGRSGVLKPWHIHLRIFLSFYEGIIPVYVWSKKAKQDLQGNIREGMLPSSTNSTTGLSRVPTQNMFIIQGISLSFFLTGDKGRGSGVQEGLNAQENLKLKAEKAKSVKCPYPACLPCLGSMCSKEQAREGS